MAEMLYMRETVLTVGNKQFDGKDFTINFEVPFNDGEELNVGTVKIYNLSEKTINEMKTNTPVILNAGYQKNVGAILVGTIKNVNSDWQGVDKITTIEVIDDKDQWLNVPIKKTYRQGTTAEEILRDLLPLTGLAVGAFELPVNQRYPGGKTVKGVPAKIIPAIAKDCKAKTHINRGKIYIRAKASGDNLGFVIDKDHGLIGSPQVVEKEDTEIKSKNKVKRKGWKVTMLLNHGVTTDVLLQIKSKTANGVFRVESGNHKCDGNQYYTEVEVY